MRNICAGLLYKTLGSHDIPGYGFTFSYRVGPVVCSFPYFLFRVSFAVTGQDEGGSDGNPILLRGSLERVMIPFLLSVVPFPSWSLYVGNENHLSGAAVPKS